MNKTYIIANWKLNPISVEEAEWLLQAIGHGMGQAKGLGKDMEVVLCPPFLYIPKLQVTSYKLHLGAQDCFWEQEGAYTGEISPHMLAQLGCEYVILGHSERKKYLGETQEMVNKKVEAALSAGLKVVLCVGENEQTPKDKENLIVVYEPEWAISSEDGQAADPAKVASRITKMRKTLKSTPILYGGSTNSKNIRKFMDAGAQGALIGSASLDAEEFISIARNAKTQ